VEVVLAAASPYQDDIDTLVAVHNNIKPTLQAIKAAYAPSEGRGSTGRGTEALSCYELEQRVAIDNLKLKALLLTLNL
jgi:hypothetical protein